MRAIEVGGAVLDVDRLEPAGAGELGQPFGIMRIALVDPGRQHPLGMTCADADRRHAALDQAVIEKG